MITKLLVTVIVLLGVLNIAVAVLINDLENGKYGHIVEVTTEKKAVTR